MINPEGLSKISDKEYSDHNGRTLQIVELPPYELQDYDFTSAKDVQKYLKDVDTMVRTSYEYRRFIAFLRNHYLMCKSGFNTNITNVDSTRIKIEIHHTPFTLYDITGTVYEKRQFYHQDLSVEMTAKEVMELHYKQMVGLYPLSETEHELVHNGYLFIPIDHIWGDYKTFVNLYKQFIDPSMIETLESVEEYSKVYDAEKQKALMTQSNLYIDPAGAYSLPVFSKLKDALYKRLDNVKENYYILPEFKGTDNNPVRNALVFDNETKH